MEDLTPRQRYEKEMVAINASMNQGLIDEVDEVVNEDGHEVTSEEYFAEKEVVEVGQGKSNTNEVNKLINRFRENSGQLGNPVVEVLIQERHRTVKQIKEIKDDIKARHTELMKELAEKSNKLLRLEGSLETIESMIIEHGKNLV